MFGERAQRSAKQLGTFGGISPKLASHDPDRRRRAEMVEGHSVHRLAIQHTARLCGRRFKATSPNGRFADGARLIDGREFRRIEAIGKNLFAFFSAVGTPSPDVVMHVHFGMSGRWSVVDASRAPDPTPTTRLCLKGDGLVSHLSAMTVDHGGVDLFERKAAALGEDPLRSDADADALWTKVSSSSKSIGALLMDQARRTPSAHAPNPPRPSYLSRAQLTLDSPQACFAGVGNIFRCEILLVAGINPEKRGNELSRVEFDKVWAASVRLMTMAFELGSIVTVTPAEARSVGNPRLRRWLYNSRSCGKCGGRVRSWDIQGRTCYACDVCQPRTGGAPPVDAKEPTLFLSHCASEPLSDRLAEPSKMRVAELREALENAGLPTSGKKAALVDRLVAHQTEAREPSTVSKKRVKKMRSARAAAADKVAANESRAVEHVAEFEDLDDEAPEWVAMPAAPRVRTKRRKAAK